MNQVIHGDSLDVLRQMDDNSIDAIVTDPPYGLSFMGKRWDYDVPAVELWEQCLRVLKPGGHLLAFAGTRTQHRMAVRIEDAGFEIRDMIMWVYGSGFPKSLDVSKAIDKAAGAEREVVATTPRDDSSQNCYGKGLIAPRCNKCGMSRNGTSCKCQRDSGPATDAARQWDGWGTALKPALEPITVARKPLSSTVAANVLQWGTGALNIDACRVGKEERTDTVRENGFGANFMDDGWKPSGRVYQKTVTGRWPANLVHDGSEEVVEQFPLTGPAKASMRGVGLTDDQFKVYGKGNPDFDTLRGYNDAGGSAARFFYCAKASRRERDAGLEGMLEVKKGSNFNNNGARPHTDPDYEYTANVRNHHATVKPIALMEWLIKLVTPPGGVVLDPFAGSGTTGCAAARLGVRSILIEREAEYVEIARRRVAYWSAELDAAAD